MYYLHPKKKGNNRLNGEALASKMSQEARNALDDGGATCLIAWTEYDEEKDEDVTWCARVGTGYPADMRLSPAEMEAQLELEWTELSRIEEEAEEEPETKEKPYTYTDLYAKRREEIKRIIAALTDEEIDLLNSTHVYAAHHMHLKGIKDKYGLSWKEVKGMIGGRLHR